MNHFSTESSMFKFFHIWSSSAPSRASVIQCFLRGYPSISLSLVSVICSKMWLFWLTVTSILFFFSIWLHLQHMGSNWNCSWGLRHSQGNTGLEPHLQPTPQLVPMLDPSSTEWGQGSNLYPHGHYIRFLTHWATMWTPPLSYVAELRFKPSHSDFRMSTDHCAKPPSFQPEW